ncbi:MAG: glutamine synthetase [Roseomonas sp.]|nr:glutamine synthetase [Roseomonas sp.]
MQKTEGAAPAPEARTASSHAKVCVADWDGILRGKYLARSKVERALEHGTKFCEVLFGWDSQDELFEGTSFAGWDSGFGDGELRLLPETRRNIPYEGGVELFLAEFAGRAEAVCPRGVLRRVLERAAASGLTVRGAMEFEFFLFEETPYGCREKGYSGLKPISPGSFGYSLLREGVRADLFREIIDVCEEMRLPIEGIHTETGPGVVEAALSHTDALEAADRATLFKTVVKILAQRRGLMATFMARWSNEWPGQSGHMHLSVLRDGHPAFHDAGGELGFSGTIRAFIAGQLALLPELAVMVAPTVNSYKRLVPGYWAPTTATWGIDNRTCAIRAIPGGPESLRVEFRVSGADVNPYLAFASAIGAGIWGIERGLQPPPPVTGNAYEQALGAAPRLPVDLREAAASFLRSDAARDLFGETFVDHYGAARVWEAERLARLVSNRELERYFEII